MAQDTHVQELGQSAALAHTRFDWSAASIALLRRRWAQGESARSIAQELGGGVSRCAVLGKVHRLKLKQPEFKQRHWRKARARRRRPAARSKRADKRGMSELMAAFHALGLAAVFGAPDARTAHLAADKAFGPACGPLDLTETTCRWPIGEPGEEGFAFCGAATFKRYPYCVGHCLIAYRPDSSESGEKGPRERAPERRHHGLERAA
ncbi:MAG TPA: GcrA family cell cycle regulator [Xanthobacteraceae bacterium]|nr:GcrA family cell cycle regulator [Xanthobacteraceae bacterium]